MKNKSVHKESSSHKSKNQCYKEILNTIDRIEYVLKNKLRNQQISLTYKVSSTKASRCQTPKHFKSCRKKVATPKSQKISITRMQTEIQDIQPFQSTMVIKSVPKTLNFISVSTTPKKAKSTKRKALQPLNNHFCSPFDDVQFKKIDKNVIKDQQNRHQSKSLWLKWNESIQKQDLSLNKKCKKSYILEEVNQNEESQRNIQKINEMNTKQLQSQVKKLQSEFEGYLLRNRGKTPSIQQKQSYRSKMTDLSYRIAKLRERQSKISMYS